MNLLAWIRSVVGFDETPAVARVEIAPSQHQNPPAANASADLDGGREPHDTGADAHESEFVHERQTDSQPEDREGVAAAPQADIATTPEIAVEAEPQTRVEVSVEACVAVCAEPDDTPSPQEIDRRRGVVRAFFNDYWSSVEDKPASFAERLDRAENYINERVAAGGETWRLGPATRKQLGLPPSKKG